jgi:hypothetical protein
MIEEKLVSKTVAAAMLGCSERELTQFRKRLGLPFRKLGRHYMYVPEELTEWRDEYLPGIRIKDLYAMRHGVTTPATTSGVTSGDHVDPPCAHRVTRALKRGQKRPRLQVIRKGAGG